MISKSDISNAYDRDIQLKKSTGLPVLSVSYKIMSRHLSDFLGKLQCTLPVKSGTECNKLFDRYAGKLFV